MFNFDKHKFIAQEGISDCGVACLLSIIKFYGGNTSFEKLREATKTTKEGTTAFHLIAAARKIGFDANGYRCDDLIKITKLPCIAHIIINNSYQHFVVIYKFNITKKIVFVFDPVLGIKKYSFHDFNEIWTKTVIILFPIKKIQNEKNEPSLFKFIFKLIKPYHKKLYLIFFISLLYILLNTIGAYYLKIIIDKYYHDYSSLCYIFVFFILVGILKVFSDYIRNLLLIFTDKEIDYSLMTETYKHIITLPYCYFESRHTGDIISRINDLNYVRELISRVSFTFMVDLLLVFGSFLILYFINHLLFFISMITILLYFVVVYIFNSKLKQFVVLNQEKQSEVNACLVETIGGINTIKGLGIEDQTINKVQNKYVSLLNNNYKFERIYNFQKFIKDLIITAGITIITFVASTLILKNQISIGNFILFNSLLVYFFEPLRSIFDIQPLLKNASNALKRINNLLNYDNETINNNLVREIKKIEFNHLKFSYNDQTKIIKDVTFSIKSSEKIMITGNSGSGKSTIFKLLLKYYKIEDNTIKINEIDINKYDISELRNSICYISQNEVLFNDSIYNNIVINRDVQYHKFLEVCKLCYVDSIISNSNLKYHQLLEENGSNLSGGERQRIILARSLLKKASIYVLDESINQVHASLERKIINNIFNFYKDKAIIMIRHNLDNVDLFDKVVVLKNGKIAKIINKEGGKYGKINKRTIIKS